MTNFNESEWIRDQGQFAGRVFTVNPKQLSLDANWGEVDIRPGDPAPYGGNVVTRGPVGEGVYSWVSTDHSNGLKLSDERNSLIPDTFRNDDAFYKTGEDAWVVVAQYPELFPHFPDGHAEQKVRDLYPDAFAAADNPDAAADTRRAEEIKWGEPKLRELPPSQYGRRYQSPWGPATLEMTAPGIATLDGEGHGGIKLSAERNKAIPAALRNSNGWYEEDCEAHIVKMYHPEAWPRLARGSEERSVMDWFPDKWEKATGNTLKPGESHVRDEQNWAASNVDNFVVRSAITDPDDNNFVLVTARRAADGADERFRIPTIEHRAGRDTGELGQGGRVVVDTDRFAALPKEPVKPKTPLKKYATVTTPDSPSAQELVKKDLSQRYRFEDGSVASVGQMIESGRITGKTSHIEKGERIYSLTAKQNEEDSTYSVFHVTAATFKAYDAPDPRTRADTLREKYDIARHKAEKQIDGAGQQFNRQIQLQREWAPKIKKLEQDWRAAQAVEEAEKIARDAAGN